MTHEYIFSDEAEFNLTERIRDNIIGQHAIVEIPGKRGVNETKGEKGGSPAQHTTPHICGISCAFLRILSNDNKMMMDGQVYDRNPYGVGNRLLWATEEACGDITLEFIEAWMRESSTFSLTALEEQTSCFTFYLCF